MADENGRPVTEREWKMSLDYHNRQHEAEERYRSQIAGILDGMRAEAKQANDVRLEGMNDLRRQLDRQAATFVTFDKYEVSHKSGSDAIAAIGAEVNRRLGVIENKQAFADGKSVAFAFAFSLVPTIIAIYGLMK